MKNQMKINYSDIKELRMRTSITRLFVLLTLSLLVSSSVIGQEVRLISEDPANVKDASYLLRFDVTGVPTGQTSDRVWVQHQGSETKEFTIRRTANGDFRLPLTLSQGENKIIVGNAPFNDGNKNWTGGESWNWVKIFTFSPVGQGLEFNLIAGEKGRQRNKEYNLQFTASYNYVELQQVKLIYNGLKDGLIYRIFERTLDAGVDGIFRTSFDLIDEGTSIEITNASGQQTFRESWEVTYSDPSAREVTPAQAARRNRQPRVVADGVIEQTIGRDRGGAGPFDVSGEVVDDASNFSLPGANLYFPATEQGYNTNVDGRFDMTLAKGEHTMEVSFVGYEKLTVKLTVNNRGAFTIRLRENSQQLEEVVVTSERADQNIKSADLGKEVLSLDMIEALPPFVGEVDVLKSLTLLPGISTVGEASSGFNVRGGGSDQNLILLGGTTLYNPSHFFGFFSSFNSDLVRDVTVYKGGIPAKYGGRASAIVDIKYKDGDYQKWNGKLSVGLISTKVSADGPLIKDKLSIVLGGRISYANWLLARSKDDDVATSTASFWDGNVILNYKINDNNSLKYSYYRSFDDFSFASDTTQGWTNEVHNLTYKGQITDKLFSTVSLSRSQYDFDIKSSFEFSSFDLKSTIVENGAYADIQYEIAENNTLTFGVQTKDIEISPGTRVPTSDISSINPISIEPESALESGIFAQHEVDLTPKIRLSYGVRYSHFNYRGPNDVFVYAPFTQRIVENIVDTVSYGSNESIVTHGGFEPRASLRYQIDPTSSIKLGYNRIHQFIHLVSNTAAISPTDTWKLSDTHIDPAVVDQYSIGIFKNFSDNTLETSIEAYYKDQKGIIEFKEGAELFLNDHLETELVSGIGRSYGVEFYVKKLKGKSTGWISYTYSRSQRKVIGSFPDEIINNGEWFAANFDKPHDLTAVLEHRISPYVDLSAVFTYSTGRPATFPIAKFRFLEDEDVAFFDSRNKSRGPDNHRLDLSLGFRFNAVRKIWRGEWKVSLYNAYGRNNPFSVFFDDLPGRPPGAFKLAVLGNPFLSASYTLKL